MGKVNELNNLERFCIENGKEYLLEEWDYVKNSPINPKTVSRASNKRVWWQCSSGHNWEAQINKRTQGRNCPVCANKHIIPGINDLLTFNPELEQEWDYEKNTDVDPHRIASKAAKKVWWKCGEGHSWIAAVYHRTDGRGCPICANKKNGDRFRKKHAEFEHELQSVNPNVRLIGKYEDSKTKILTLCLLCGLTWSAWPNDLRKGAVCPRCAKKRTRDVRYQTILEKIGSLQERCPEIASEWHPIKNKSLTPSDVTPGSTIKVWWKCKNEHEWRANVYSRTNGRGCPYCSNKRALAGDNDLETQYPELAKEWHPNKNTKETPSTVTPGSGKRVWWKCAKGHEWIATVASRVRGNGCPYCSGKAAIPGINDLLTLNPELASEWHPTLNGKLSPQDVMPGSEKKVWWICDKGHSWKAMVYNRLKGNGCPICSNQAVLKGYNDLSTLFSELTSEWNYEKNGKLMPDMVTPGSGKRVWWKCVKGHEWKTEVRNRTKDNGTGCPQCAVASQSSFPEQAIFYYCSQVFDSISRYRDSGFELDIYIPSKKTGVEYDGVYYHNSGKSIEREKKKNDFFFSKGIRIIRIKESDVNQTEENTIKYKLNYSYEYLPWAIYEMFLLLGVSSEIPDINIPRDRALIYQSYLVKEKDNSIASRFPELLDEWDYEKNKIDPSAVSYGSTLVFHWKCKLGHTWESSANARTNTKKKGGCPVCGQIQRANNGQKTKLLRNGSLQDINPELAKEWHPTKNHGLTPQDVTSASGKKVWWLCSNGHEWESRVNNRKNGNGCPICRTEHMRKQER